MDNISQQMFINPGNKVVLSTSILMCHEIIIAHLKFQNSADFNSFCRFGCYIKSLGVIKIRLVQSLKNLTIHP